MITNAFSINMLPRTSAALLFLPLNKGQAAELAAGLPSAVGHADTAAVFAAVLQVPVACNRATVRLRDGAWLLVGQYTGPRLPEGATALPEGAEIAWWWVGPAHQASVVDAAQWRLSQKAAAAWSECSCCGKLAELADGQADCSSCEEKFAAM